MPLAAAQGSLGYPRYGYTTLPKSFGYITVIENSSVYTTTVFPAPMVVDKSSISSVPYYFLNTETTPNVNLSGVIKLTKDGEPTLSNKYRSDTDYSGYAEDFEFYKSVVDSSKNVICVGRFKYYNFDKYCSFVCKIDENNTLQWSTMIESSSGTTANNAIDVKVDSSNNIYILTAIDSTHAQITKLNAAGAKLWGNNVNTARALVIDSSGNLYATIRNGLNNPQLHKISTTGSSVWAKSIACGTNPNYFQMATDGTNIGYIQDNGYVIFDNAGNLIRNQGVDYTINVIDIAMDPYGVVYLLGSVYNVGSNSYDAYIFAFQSDDSLMYANKLVQVGGSFEPKGMTYHKGSIYISGENTTNSAIYSVRLPSYGLIPGTGNYQVIIGSNTYNFQLTSYTATPHTSTSIVTTATPAYSSTGISNIGMGAQTLAEAIDYGVTNF